MPKTITLRVEDEVYDMIKTAAEGDKITISNFLEYATVSYITHEAYVSDEEMEDIMKDKALVRSLRAGISDAKKGKYKVVK